MSGTSQPRRSYTRAATSYPRHARLRCPPSSPQGRGILREIRDLRYGRAGQAIRDPLARLVMEAAFRAEFDELVQEQLDYRVLRALLDAWAAWEIACCEERCGHRWWLDIHPGDGTDGVSVELRCQHCPAGPDDIFPDGQEVLCGRFPVMAGYILHVDYGTVWLNGDRWRGSPDRFTYGWRGPVTAEFRENGWYDYEYGPQWDPEIVLAPLPG